MNNTATPSLIDILWKFQKAARAMGLELDLNHGRYGLYFQLLKLKRGNTYKLVSSHSTLNRLKKKLDAMAATKS
jgi:hypothetical protein